MKRAVLLFAVVLVTGLPVLGQQWDDPKDQPPRQPTTERKLTPEEQEQIRKNQEAAANACGTCCGGATLLTVVGVVVGIVLGLLLLVIGIGCIVVLVRWMTVQR